MTWFEAEENCMQSNGHLVSIHDVDEAEFIQYMMTSNWTQSSSKTYIGNILKHLPKKKCEMIITNVLNVIIITIFFFFFCANQANSTSTICTHFLLIIMKHKQKRPKQNHIIP